MTSSAWRTPETGTLDTEAYVQRVAVVQRAESFERSGFPAGARRDCSGFILAAYRAAGTPLDIPDAARRADRNASAQLHDWSERSHRAFRAGSPSPGDLVFFRDTVAARGIHDHVTHVAMVERVEDDGTVILIHYMGGKIRHDPMNLARPDDPSKNVWLRKKKHAGEPALAGELFVAYARLLR